MAVTDQKIAKDAKVAIETKTIAIITAVSLTDVIALKFKPGYAFQIVAVECWARVEAGVVTADVKIGATSVLTAAMAFATATRVEGVLAAAQETRRGSATDEINVHFTTDAAGVLTNGFVTIQLRPQPLNGEIYSS